MNEINLIILFAFIFGLVLGSFLNVCIHRIPLKQSIVRPPSSCPNCGHRIRFYDNIPIVSYLILLGRCRYCKQRISIQYLLIELITGLLSTALIIRFGLGYHYLALLAFTSALLVITFIDLKYQIIPDVISIPGIILGFLASILVLPISWFESLIGILVGGGSFYLIAILFQKIKGREGMGGGDIKLLAMIGAWMGWGGLPFIILIASLTGLLLGGGSLLLSRHGIQTRIPFGPFLALGALIFLFFEREIVSSYFRLMF